MLNNKLILTIFVCICIAGCKTAKIPEAYNFRVKELQKNPYGCWMEITTRSNSIDSSAGNNSFSGELLAFQGNSVYLLVADGKVKSIKKNAILAASLYTHKNQSGTYAAATGVLMAPGLIGAAVYAGSDDSEFAGYILLMTIPVAVVGLYHTIIEATTKRNILMYPNPDSLDNFKPFARFPAGIPDKIQFESLYLKR